MSSYRKAVMEILKGKPRIDDWQAYYAAKRNYERKTCDLPFNEFEFNQALEAFAKHFTDGGK